MFLPFLKKIKLAELETKRMVKWKKCIKKTPLTFSNQVMAILSLFGLGDLLYGVSLKFRFSENSKKIFSRGGNTTPLSGDQINDRLESRFLKLVLK